MDAFRELTSEEIKLTTLQFLGQHLTSELKELDKNIVSKNQTLQGITIDPVRVLKTIPTNQVSNIPQPSPIATAVNAGINVQPVPIQAQVVENKSNLSLDNSQILASLKRIEDKLDVLINKP